LNVCLREALEMIAGLNSATLIPLLGACRIPGMLRESREGCALQEKKVQLQQISHCYTWDYIKKVV